MGGGRGYSGNDPNVGYKRYSYQPVPNNNTKKNPNISNKPAASQEPLFSPQNKNKTERKSDINLDSTDRILKKHFEKIRKNQMSNNFTTYM